jgi:Lipopolysaccharide-assembly
LKPLVLTIAVLFTLAFSSCKWFPYKFNDASVPPNLKTFKVLYIENKARYINPQLSPQITDRLRQKITNQTRLSPANDGAHLEISATITEYSVTTSGVSGTRESSTNRLNIGMSINIKNNVEPDKSIESSISRSIDFPANLTLTQAETQYSEEIIKNVVDEIFNKIFSNW